MRDIDDIVNQIRDWAYDAESYEQVCQKYNDLRDVHSTMEDQLRKIKDKRGLLKKWDEIQSKSYWLEEIQWLAVKMQMYTKLMGHHKDCPMHTEKDPEVGCVCGYLHVDQSLNDFQKSYADGMKL